ncbi:hypothetical protein AeRB84_015708 [Aphanomyces euteiches]|nr:hypothetical protein AeRB84_015708 [Aphanomyces euteiches]
MLFPPAMLINSYSSTLLLCIQSVTIPSAVSKSMEEGAAAHPGRNEVLVDGLTFSSNFDSGNLLSVDRGRALDAGRCEYVVTAAPDASKPDTPPEAQITPTTWFHFSISGAVAGQEIALQIVNLIKHTALYDQDTRPVVRSLPSQKKWERLRQGVTYQADRQTNEFSIRFTYTVAVAGETVFFAFCYPYSYTDGQRMLRRLDQDFARRERTASSMYYHRETLVHSLDGRKVDLLTISSYDNILDNREETIPGLFPDHPHTPRPFQFQNKRVIFLTSRVHPAETPSSFVLDGALSFLLKRDDPRAYKLLKECVFKVIPMLNPDGKLQSTFTVTLALFEGVARGHYRLDSLGANLNRHYISPTMDKHPTIFAAKAAILATCHTMSKLALHVDLHAHAAKRGCFIYGNRYATATEQALSQVYPKLIGLNSVHFEYDQCNFTEQNMHLVEKRDHGLSKDGCARVALHRETSGIPVYFYTLECNFNMGRRPGSIPHSGSGLMSTAPLSPEVTRKAYVPKYTTASWEDVGKGMMVAVLDWLGTNEWSRIPHSQWRTMTGFIQDIKNQVAPSFDQHKETNKSSVKKNKQQEKLEKKRYGCVGLPPATKTTPRSSSRTSTRSSNNNNAAF